MTKELEEMLAAEEAAALAALDDDDDDDDSDRRKKGRRLDSHRNRALVGLERYISLRHVYTTYRGVQNGVNTVKLPIF